MLSPLQLFWPDLWDRVFTPGYVPADQKSEEEDVFFPTSGEDFEALMEQMDQEEAEADAQRRWTPGPPPAAWASDD